MSPGSRIPSWLSAFAFLLAFCVPGVAQDAADFFEKRVRPILAEHCYECHSAASVKLKGGLRLDSPDLLARGGTSGRAFIAGNPDDSLLLKAVRGDDPEFRMPPKGPSLSAAQIADLAEWIQTGAILPKVSAPTTPSLDAKSKWAFSKPLDHGVPSVKNMRWVKQPIDQFILTKIEAEGKKPAKPADKRTLIRRATFDLIGLPPTPAEIDAFLVDNSPDAFSKVVERLLASPHYGERWGRHWLDVARYADSADARVTGGNEDFAEAWRYRDWVVNAFNQDLPYDQFITLQIAGDLLPPPNDQAIDTNAIIATGMYAIGNWGNGDADKEKVLTDIADDAVDVTGRAFLGLTLSCARCHDHKFDPISIEDYYGMAGIFFSSHIVPKLAAKGSGESLLRIPLVSAKEMENRKQREARIAELEKQIEQMTDGEISRFSKEMLPLVADYLLAARKDSPPRATTDSLNPVILQRWRDFLDRSHLGLLPNPINESGANKGLLVWRNSNGDDTPAAIYNSAAGELAKVPPQKVAIHPSPNHGIAVAWRATQSGKYSVSGKITDVDAACGDGVKWSIAKRSGRILQNLADGVIANGAAQELSDQLIASKVTDVDLDSGEMLQVTILPNNGHGCDTTQLDLQIEGADGKKWDFARQVGANFLSANPLPDLSGARDVWHLMDLAIQPNDSDADASPLHFLSAPDTRSREEAASNLQRALIESTLSADIPEPIRKFHRDLTEPRGAFWGPLRKSDALNISDALRQLKSELVELTRIPTPPIEFANGLQEGGVPESPRAGVHDVAVHIRGRYDRLGEIVPRRFPMILAGAHQPVITNGSGRLQLAQWIASTNNPLTARVMVNRVWMHHFGEGIVRTPNNYGKLGAEPTHPELLDFLAHRFMESGWRVKNLHRMMMLSATYQQASASSDAALDPENKLFARMSRRRLEAEPFRDSLLFVADELDRTMGGRSIRPFENNRRTLYLMTIRSDRSNYRMLFDAADPVGVAEQRNVSTVAPQALFLLNHPMIMEKAAVLAKRVQRAGTTDDQKVRWLYEQLYGRPPIPKEIKIARKALSMAPNEATGTENLSAWTQYCQALLCGNEFIYVD